MLSVFKWKYGGLEAEVRGVLAGAAEVTEEARAAAKTTDAVIPSAVAEEAAAPEAGKQSSSASEERTKPASVFGLLVKEKNYAEALAQMRKEEADREPDHRIRREAGFYFFAFKEGFSEAFADLGRYVAANPSAWAPHYWLSRLLEMAGQPIEALASVRTAHGLAGSANERISAAVHEADLLVAAGSSRLVAARVIGKELQAVHEPSDRGRIFTAIANVFQTEDRDDIRTRLMMFEAAVHYNPTNPELLFAAAYACGDNGAEDFAFGHYQQLIEIREDYPSALNNAGVAANKLGLPITGVGYYKRAEQIGESLATANLANNLLRPGFINEARQRLFEARQKYGEDVHRNVSEHTGTAATAEAREEESLEEIRKRVPRVAKWKARLAEAIIQEPTTVSGEFTQGGLTLEVRSDGSVSGKLGVDSKDALVTGQVIGCMVEFSWKTTKPTEAPGSIASFLGSYYRERSGYGRGVIVSPSRIDGYHGEGDHPVDSTGSEKWTEFSLAAKEA